MALSTGDGGSGRRRIDDVRQLLGERRRQSLQQQQQQQEQQQEQQRQRQHQYEYDVDEMVVQMNHQLDEYHSDANTMASSTISGGGGSGGGGFGCGGAPASSTTTKSPATYTRSAQSSRLSTTRKNMMQRRIEMRRKNEERQQQEKMTPRQQQLLQQSQSDAPHSRQPQQSSSNNPSDDGARNVNYYSRPVSHQPYQSQQQNYYQGQGVQQHHPDWRDYPNNSDLCQERVQLQQQDPSSQERQPQLENHQYQSQNSQNSHHHPHWAQLQQLPKTQQSQSQHQYSREQAAQLVLLSPPMVQRTGESRNNEQAIHQYYIMKGGDLPMEEDIRDGHAQYSFDSDFPGETNHYQVYNQNELERSGIIRDSRAPAQLQQQQQQQQPPPAASATVNRLKHYEAPSDEWHNKNSPPSGWHGYNTSSEGTGFDSAAMNEQLRLLGRNQDQQQQQQPTTSQYHLQSQQYPWSQSQAKQRQPQQQHSGKDAHHDTESQHQRQTNAVGHQDPSMQGASATRPSEYTDHNDEPDEMHQQKPSLLQSHHTQDYQQLHDQNQYHSQNQPNWKHISQLYHDGNRQRFYKLQLTSRQQYQERQKQQVDNQYQGHHEQQQSTLQQREQQEPSPISTLSPIDHLGNRTDHIQRKNKFLPSMTSKSLSSSQSTRNKGHHYLTVASNNDSHSLDEEIGPVSEQARTFDNAAGLAGEIQGQVSRGRSRQPVLHQQQQQEEDTVSVASIRKGWVEKNNILKEQQERQAQRQAQQRRREQRKSIEDRWMNNRRKDTVKSVPPPEKRGYKAQHHELESQGYQSEGERRNNSRSERYDGGYQSQDPDAITPKDARRRLWDEHERLRAVLPKHEKFECNNVRGRWPEHKIKSAQSNNGLSPPSQFTGGLASPGNNSGSSLEAEGRFKSKFVHAAALAAQQRLANIDSGDRQRPHYSQQSQWQSQQQHQQQLQPFGESQHQHQLTGQQHQQQHKYTTTNTNYSQKGIAVSSHYTDSTAEITADITTIPEGSNGSSSNRGTLQNNSSRMSSNLVARTVTPSPPKHYSRTHNHDSSSAMPPIDEQGVTPSLKIQTDTTSVADLIARINAVSRSNPEEALAAIDSIIKKEGGGYSHVHRNVGGRRSGVGGPAIIAHPEILRNGPYDHHVVEGYRNCVGTPAIMAHQGISRSGPASVVAPAPSKIARDNSLLGQRLRFSNEFLQDVVAGRGNEDYRDQDDDDDSLLSSDDSTVSSMTNPTYQSIPAQKVAQNKATRSTVSPMTDPTYQSIRPKPRKALPPTASQESINSIDDHSFIQKSSLNQQLENFPPIKSQKSWNTLKKEYTVLKSSPPIHTFSTDEMNALNNFSPNIEPHDDDIRQQLQQPIQKQSPINSISTSAWVPIPQQRDVFGKTRSWDEEKKLRPFTRTTPAAPNNSRDNHMAYDQRTSTEQPAHPQKGKTQSRDKFPTQDSAPGDNMNTDPRTVDFPEIMTVVSHAFADVDINLEAAKTTTKDTSMSLKQLRPIQSYKSKGDTVENPLPRHRQLPSSAECSTSLHETISEAFSDVDISFEQDMTVSERRKQLEYLSASWLEDKNSRTHERSKGKSETFAGSSQVRESLHKTNATATNQKKKVEPTIRLKGNKNLAQKFARLVNAFE